MAFHMNRELVETSDERKRVEPAAGFQYSRDVLEWAEAAPKMECFGLNVIALWLRAPQPC